MYPEAYACILLRDKSKMFATMQTFYMLKVT
jgi:hypothetical protein